MLLMNTQSNASSVSIEAVAFMAAIDNLQTPRSRILLLDRILDTAFSQSLTSLQRQTEIRQWLAVSQSLVEFVGVFDDGLLEHPEEETSVMKHLLEGSSISTNEIDDTILWIQTCKRLGAKIVK